MSIAATGLGAGCSLRVLPAFNPNSLDSGTGGLAGRAGHASGGRIQGQLRFTPPWALQASFRLHVWVLPCERCLEKDWGCSQGPSTPHVPCTALAFARLRDNGRDDGSRNKASLIRGGNHSSLSLLWGQSFTSCAAISQGCGDERWGARAGQSGSCLPYGSWDALGCAGMSWDMLEWADTCWDVLGRTGMSWDMVG